MAKQLFLQDFLLAYGSITGKSLGSGDLEKLGSSNAIVVFGTRICDDNREVSQYIRTISQKCGAKVIYMHPIEDIQIDDILTQFIKYEVGSEEGVVALLVETLLRDVEVSDNIRAVLDDLDIGNLSAESNVGEEELEELRELLNEVSTISFVVGADVYAHSQATSIARYLGLLDRYLGFNILFVPPKNSREDSIDSELRGYLSNPVTVELDEQIKEPEEMEEFGGAVVYNCNSEDKQGILLGSQQFSTATKLKDGDRVNYTIDGVSFSRLFKIDKSMKGTVALNPTDNINSNVSLLSSYRFHRLEFKKVGMEK